MEQSPAPTEWPLLPNKNTSLFQLNCCSKMADPPVDITDWAGLSLAEVSLSEVDTCELEIKKKYEVIPSVICSICLLFGIIYCFLGYRCFKMVMFVSGFVFGSAAVYLLYLKEPVLDIQLGMETKAGIGLGVGVLCGLVTMLVCILGLFILGLQLGFLLTLANMLVVGQFYSLTPAWVPLSALLSTSVVCAIFTLQWQKLFTVLSTAVLGAAVVMVCVDYLVETSLLAGHVYDMLCLVPPRPLCWFSWVITGICPLLGLIGVLVQWKLTAHGVSYTEAIVSRRQKQVKLMQIRQREARRRPNGTYQRRKPPPLKRYAGDVLAPSYLQSLRERQMGTGSSAASAASSNISTVTHTMIDFDYETGSMVPLVPTWCSSPVYTV